MFIDSAKEKLPKAVSQDVIAKPKKRRKQSVDAKPFTDEALKKRKKKKVIFIIKRFSCKWFRIT